jgi:stress response protein YsnF
LTGASLYAIDKTERTLVKGVAMESQEAKQKVHEFLERVRGYKRWHYRRTVLISLLVLFEREGVKIKVGKESVSFEREMVHGEKYKATFRLDGTIQCEVYDERGPLVVVTGSIEDFLVEVLTGVVPVVGS